MVCIYCGNATQVTNSRHQKRTNHVWRRRLCMTCKLSFTTHETVEFGNSISVRHSGHKLIPFSRDTLFISIYESCKHRKTAVSDATALTQTIISQLQGCIHEGTLERSVIAAIAAATLERYDPIAATVYGAYHSHSPAD